MFAHHLEIYCRFAMRLDLAGDGNFSADHVAQNPPSNDYHLLDGGGMFPNRQEYLDFLQTAMERNTVSHGSGGAPVAGAF
jgi:hypothetical protein